MKRAKLLFLVLTLVALASCQGTDGEWMFNKAVKLWKAEKHEEAVQNFNALITAYPESSLVDDSLFWIGNIYEHYLYNPTQAIRYYRMLNKGFEDSKFQLKAMLALARLYNLKDKEGKRKSLLIRKKIQELQVQTNLFDLNQFEIAKLELTFKHYEKARFELKRLINNSINQAHIAGAYNLIGTSYYLEGKLKLAELTFLEIEKKNNFSKNSLPSALRLAELYEEVDQLGKAINIYQSIIHRLDKKEVLYQLSIGRISKLKARQKKTSKS